MQRVNYYNLTVIVLLSVFVFAGAASVYNDSASYDERAHILFGQQTIAGGAEHASMQRMPITALNALPFLIIKPENLPDEQDILWIYRLPTILFSVVLGLIIFVWSKNLYGIKGGLLSLFLFVFCPNTVAHSRLATTDMYCALFMFLSVFSFTLYLKCKTWPRLVSAAVLVGLAQLTKQTALLLLPLLSVIYCLHLLDGRRTQGRFPHGRVSVAVAHLVACMLIVLAIINAGYGFKGSGETLQKHRNWLVSANQLPEEMKGTAGLFSKAVSEAPLPLPRAYAEAFILGQFYNKTGEGHGPIYMLGNLSQLGWWYYFPVTFLLKTPIPSLLFIALSVGAVIAHRRLKPGADERTLLVSVVAISIFFCFFCTAQIGIRYMLPVMPFLYVLAGKVAEIAPAQRPGVWKSTLIVLLIWLPVSFFSYYPHFISYFNEFCPDRLRLYRYLADSNIDWGQNDNYLAQYLNDHYKKKVVVNPPTPATGTVIVNVNYLVGVMSSPARFAWLREQYSPIDHIAYSWLVYEIPQQPDTRIPLSHR